MIAKLIERRGVLTGIRAVWNGRSRLQSEATISLDNGQGGNDLSLVLSTQEAATMRAALLDRTGVVVTVVIEVDEASVRERIATMERELQSLQALVGP